jgi:hypothetical protein
MKIVPRLALAVCCSVGLAGRAAEPFTQTVPPAEFNAAGLDKLTPAELTRLDALVLRYRAGELEAARRTAAAEAEAKAVEQVRAAKAEAEARATAQVQAAKAEAATAQAQTTTQARGAKSGGIAGFFSKVILPPGTEVEYEKAETEIVGVFAGFTPGTIIALANGQRWRVVSGSYVTAPMPKVRKVWIEPGLLGSFYLRFEGVGVQPKVTAVRGR